MPTDNDRYVAFLDRANANDKVFRIFDVFQGHFCRKYLHRNQNDEAFNVSPNA